MKALLEKIDALRAPKEGAAPAIAVRRASFAVQSRPRPRPVQNGTSPIADLMPFTISCLNCG